MVHSYAKYFQAISVPFKLADCNASNKVLRYFWNGFYILSLVPIANVDKMVHIYKYGLCFNNLCMVVIRKMNIL